MSKRKLSQSAVPWWKDTKSELYAAPAAPAPPAVQAAPAPFINEQGASTAQNPYAPKEQKSQQFANEVFNNDTDENRATDEKVQARVGQIVEIVQELSLTLFQLIISDSEALKITKEILKDISSRVAHIPIDEVIDKIDDYLSKVDKGEKKSDEVEGATPTAEQGIPNQAGGANDAGGPNIEGSPNEAGAAPKMAFLEGGILSSKKRWYNKGETRQLRGKPVKILDVKYDPIHDTWLYAVINPTGEIYEDVYQSCFGYKKPATESDNAKCDTAAPKMAKKDAWSGGRVDESNFEEALKVTPYALNAAPTEFQLEHPDVVFDALNRNARAVRYVCPEFKAKYPEDIAKFEEESERLMASQWDTLGVEIQKRQQPDDAYINIPGYTNRPGYSKNSFLTAYAAVAKDTKLDKAKLISINDQITRAKKCGKDYITLHKFATKSGKEEMVKFSE